LLRTCRVPFVCISAAGSSLHTRCELANCPTEPAPMENNGAPSHRFSNRQAGLKPTQIGMPCEPLSCAEIRSLFFLFCFCLQERIHRSPYKFGRRRPCSLTDGLQTLHLVWTKIDVRTCLHRAARYTPLRWHESTSLERAAFKTKGPKKREDLTGPASGLLAGVSKT
jgi:hypothetical protein